ncbi:MAG: penicillin-binding protein 2 [Gallionellaceae bacterium]|jgi:cell division protein FtsI (penicillin-binding protein 3)|nr:penicillin-binding protein 2 [Gallionellaceae bacterium]
MNHSAAVKTAGVAALPPLRAQALSALLLLGLCVLVGRAVYLQGIHDTFLQREGDARYGRVVNIVAHRGMITDRYGEPLAVSTPVESVWASPQDADMTKEQINQLARALDMKAGDIQKKLSGASRDFVYLKRQLPPEQAEKVMQMEAPGVSLRREYRRYYPAGEMTAQLLGFTDVDDNGQEGLELAMQSVLGGQAGSQRVIKDRRGRIVEDVASLRAPKPGNDLALSLDSKVQYLAFREIKQVVEQYRAKSGAIVVLDAKTGEVLALANWPSYNPNNRAKPQPQALRNRAVTDAFEPGSTMKTFTVAAALDAGKVKPASVIDTGDGVLTVGGRKIHDTHPEPRLSVAQVLQVSSNVGAAKMALSMSPETFWNNLHDAGFGMPTNSGFPGETAGVLRDHRKWVPIDQATISYGNGISVNLLQLARAYTIFANDGELLPVTFYRQEAAPAGKRVFSVATARAVRGMLEKVVQSGGTAPQAQVNGYRVAGKTGTAHKLEGGRYVNRYVASFVGMAPASNPRLIVAVMVDDPAGAQYYGGQVAAPAFSNVMGAALRLLNVPNDAPLNKPSTVPVTAVREET